MKTASFSMESTVLVNDGAVKAWPVTEAVTLLGIQVDTSMMLMPTTPAGIYEALVLGYKVTAAEFPTCVGAAPALYINTTGSPEFGAVQSFGASSGAGGVQGGTLFSFILKAGAQGRSEFVEFLGGGIQCAAGDYIVFHIDTLAPGPVDVEIQAVLQYE